MTNDQSTNRGWHERGYLPHFDGRGRSQFITYRLADALPTDVVKELLLEFSEQEQKNELRQRIARYLDAGHGECLLRNPVAAQIVIDSWKFRDGSHYELLEWVVMPNHVHALVKMLSGFGLSEVVQGWKSFTSRMINKALNRNGTVWQADNWDTYIRDQDHLVRIVDYIHQNPVKAGMVAEVGAYRWSSAWRG